MGKKIFLDIGAGNHPAFEFQEKHNPHFSIVFDITHEKVAQSFKRQASLGVESGGVAGDARELPFKADSVDKIYLADVLNSPVREYSSDKPRQEGVQVINIELAGLEASQRDEAENHFTEAGDRQVFVILDDIIKEAKRVLKPGGELEIRERFDITHREPYNYILKRLQQDPGLKLKKQPVQGDSAYLYIFKKNVLKK